MRVVLLLLCVALALACTEDATAPPPDIVLVVLDTVRADYTGGRGPGDGYTPFLDELASEATSFANAWAVAPWTVPSHASMFTGMLPSAHGCTMRDVRLETDAPTLAQVLGQAGYETAAFFANPWLTDNATGLLRGFETRREAPYGGFMNRPVGSGGYQGGRAVLRGIENWLGARPADRPFFLFVNLLEPHLPYDPPPKYRAGFLPNVPRMAKVTIRWGVEFNAGVHPAETVDWERVRALYGGDVHTVDGLLARLVELLKRKRLYDDAVLVVTSDHGENLGEPGLIGHQFSVDEALLSVPLVIRAPHVLESGVREDSVMLTDLFATILDCAGIRDIDVPAHSRSLLAPPATETRPVFAEYAGPHESILRLLRQANPRVDVEPLKRAFRRVRLGDDVLTADSAGTITLHRLGAGGDRRRNVADEFPDEVRRLEAILDLEFSATTDPPPNEPKLDEETRTKLRSLGYVD